MPKKNAHGFSVVSIVLALFCMLAVIGAGWWVWQRTHSAKTSPKETKQTVKAPVIPAGYKKYTNDAFGFSFAYPAEWGALTPDAAPSTLAYLHSDTTTDKGYTPAGLRNKLYVGVKEKKDFRIDATFYGPLVQFVPEEKAWKAIVPERGYKYGQVYPVKSNAAPSGLTVYTFETERLGCITRTLVFEAQNGFTMIDLPELCRVDGDENQKVEAASRAAFDTLTGQVLNSISVP